MSTPESSNDIPNGSEPLLSASPTNPKSKPAQGATSLDGTSTKGSGGKDLPQKLLKNKDLSELRSCYDDIIKNMPDNYLDTVQLLERQLLDSHILSILECSHFSTANQTILECLVEGVTCKADVLDLCESLLLLENAPQLVSIVENLRMVVVQNLQTTQPQPQQQQQQQNQQQHQHNANGHKAADKSLLSNQTASSNPKDNVNATNYDKTTHCIEAENQSSNPGPLGQAMKSIICGMMDKNPSQDGSQSNDQFVQGLVSMASSTMGVENPFEGDDNLSTEEATQLMGSLFSSCSMMENPADSSKLADSQSTNPIVQAMAIFSGMMGNPQGGSQSNDQGNKTNSSEDKSQSQSTDPTSSTSTAESQSTNPIAQVMAMFPGMMGNPQGGSQSNDQGNKVNSSKDKSQSQSQSTDPTSSTSTAESQSTDPFAQAMAMFSSMTGNPQGGSQSNDQLAQAMTSMASSMMRNEMDSSKGGDHKLPETPQGTQLPNAQDLRAKRNQYYKDTHSKSHSSAASQSHTTKTTATGVTRGPQRTQNTQWSRSSQCPPLKPARVVHGTLSKSKSDTGVANQTNSSIATVADAVKGAQKPQSTHYKIYVQYYSKLTSILEVDLTPHFVTAEMITFSEEDEITKLSATSNTAAMKMLLKPVSFSLEAGYTTSFYNMLEIIKKYGNNAAQCLAAEIFAEVEKLGVKKSDATEKLPPTTPITHSTTCTSVAVDVSTSVSNSTDVEVTSLTNSKAQMSKPPCDLQATEKLPPTTPNTHSTTCTSEAVDVSTSVSNSTDVEVTSLTNFEAQMSKPPRGIQATSFDVTSEHRTEVVPENIPQKPLDHGATEELPSTTQSTTGTSEVVVVVSTSVSNCEVVILMVLCQFNVATDTGVTNSTTQVSKPQTSLQATSFHATSEHGSNVVLVNTPQTLSDHEGSHCCHVEKPKLKELVLYSNKIATQWKEVALLLDIPQDVVNTIDLDKNEMKQKCYRMFDVWLQRTVDSCWCQFVSALVEVDLLKTAKEIQQKFIGEGHVLSDAKLEEKLRQYDPESNNELCFQPPPSLPLSHIERSDLLNSMVDVLLQHDTSNISCVDILITGMAGYGKTTLAKSLCHHSSIKKWFSAGFLWIHLGPAPKSKPVAMLLLLYKKLTGKPWTSVDAHTQVKFSEQDTMAALSSELQALCRNAKLLVILDDVWEIEDVHTYIDTFSCCKLVVTSRRKDFPQNFDCNNKFVVEGMTPTQATNLLTVKEFQPLNSDTIKQLDELAVNLHYWPLLLSLVHKQFQKHYDMKPNISAITVIKGASQKLSKYGLTAFDHPSSREFATAACIKASLDFLDQIVVTRLVRLVTSYTFGNVFPKSLLSNLWEIDSEEVDNSCEALWSMGLLQYVDLSHNVDAESTDGIEIHSTIIQYVFDNELDRAFNSMKDYYHSFVQNTSSLYKYTMNLYKNAIISGSLSNFLTLQTFVDSMMIPTTLKAVPMILHLMTNALVTKLPPMLSQFINMPKRNTFMKIRRQCKRMTLFIENGKNDEALEVYKEEKMNCHSYLREMYNKVPHQLQQFVDQILSQISNQLDEFFVLPETMLKLYLTNRSKLLRFFNVNSTKNMEERLQEMLTVLKEMFHDFQSSPIMNKVYEQVTTFSEMSADTESGREAMLRRLALSQLPNADPDAMAKFMNNPSACCVM